MFVSKIRKLIKLVEESNIGELEVSAWGQTIRISKKAPFTSTVVTPQVIATADHTATDGVDSVAENKERVEEGTDHLVPVKSPMVGTFYRAPAPDAKPYVEVNQQITVGQVVCIIEAMKLMNEIETEVAGRVDKILVENGKPIEFGQTLFLVEPA